MKKTADIEKTNEVVSFLDSVAARTSGKYRIQSREQEFMGKVFRWHIFYWETYDPIVEIRSPLRCNSLAEANKVCDMLASIFPVHEFRPQKV